DRPFYNIWPVAVDLAKSVRLDVSLAHVRPMTAMGDTAAIPIDGHCNPTRSIDLVLLRFASGREPYNIENAFIKWQDKTVDIAIAFKGKGGYSISSMAFQNDS